MQWVRKGFNVRFIIFRFIGSPYYERMGYQKGLCPNAEKIYQRIMSIPLYPKMTDQDVDDVICAVKKIIKNYKE